MSSDPPPPLPFDISRYSLTEMIRLQNQLADAVARRFEICMALAFVDIVASTAYFAQFGDVAGRALQQLHLDLLNQSLASHNGRVVDTAGDGAFVCFVDPMDAARSMTELLMRVSAVNEHRAREHQLTLRIAMHWGRVLSDGALVTGDNVNLSARLAATAEPGELRVSQELFQELDAEQRRRCRPVGAVEVRGARRPMEVLAMDWLDRSLFPDVAIVRETQEQIALPLRDTISFGRLQVQGGRPANDIVLALPDGERTRLISRWHFELRRRETGYVLRVLSSQGTKVDGRELGKGAEVPIAPGTVVRCSDVITLDFLQSGSSVPRTMDHTGIPLLRQRPAIEDPLLGAGAEVTMLASRGSARA